MPISAAAVAGLRRLRLTSCTPLSPSGTAEETRISAPSGTGIRSTGKPGTSAPAAEYGGGVVGNSFSPGLSVRPPVTRLEAGDGVWGACTVPGDAVPDPALSAAESLHPATAATPRHEMSAMRVRRPTRAGTCLLYTSDAADDLLCVDLGGRRIIKKK